MASSQQSTGNGKISRSRLPYAARVNAAIVWTVDAAIKSRLRHTIADERRPFFN
jgi:hypothetical protein